MVGAVARPALSRALLYAASPGVGEAAHEFDHVLALDEAQKWAQDGAAHLLSGEARADANVGCVP